MYNKDTLRSTREKERSFAHVLAQVVRMITGKEKEIQLLERGGVGRLSLSLIQVIQFFFCYQSDSWWYNPLGCKDRCMFAVLDFFHASAFFFWEFKLIIWLHWVLTLQMCCTWCLRFDSSSFEGFAVSAWYLSVANQTTKVHTENNLSPSFLLWVEVPACSKRHKEDHWHHWQLVVTPLTPLEKRTTAWFSKFWNIFF